MWLVFIAAIPLLLLVSWFVYKLINYDRDKEAGVGFWEVYKEAPKVENPPPPPDKKCCKQCGLEKTEYYCIRCFTDDDGYTAKENYNRFNYPNAWKEDNKVA